MNRHPASPYRPVQPRPDVEARLAYAEMRRVAAAAADRHPLPGFWHLVLGVPNGIQPGSQLGDALAPRGLDAIRIFGARCTLLEIVGRLLALEFGNTEAGHRVVRWGESLVGSLPAPERASLEPVLAATRNYLAAVEHGALPSILPRTGTLQ